MRRITLLVLTLVLATAPLACGDQKTESKQQFVRPFPFVMVPIGASDVHKALAQKLADAIGVHVISEMRVNPVCCVWIQITHYVPNPGEPGYFILNQGGGSLVSATDEAQLKSAVDRFIASSRKQGDSVEVPVGMMTSYAIVAPPSN